MNDISEQQKFNISNKNIVELLLKNGFEANIYNNAYDKDNFRVFFDDIDVIVVKFVDLKTKTIKWKNKIDGNMVNTDIIKLVNLMVEL